MQLYVSSPYFLSNFTSTKINNNFWNYVYRKTMQLYVSAKIIILILYVDRIDKIVKFIIDLYSILGLKKLAESAEQTLKKYNSNQLYQ